MAKVFWNKKKRHKGFTLVETLVVVAIVICLLAVSAVAIVKYMKHLQITELDNTAREIYMAAQNRAVLLKNGGKLENLVIEDDLSNEMKNVDVNAGEGASIQMTFYYVHKSADAAELGELLPEGTIEPALWEGDFYIVYEPVSGSVTDVFFAKEDLKAADSGFRHFYDTWRGAKKSERMKQDPMIGYYGGDAAESGTTISLRTPVINIINEEELYAEVTYWLPRVLVLEKENVVLDVEIGYGETTVALNDPSKHYTESAINLAEYIEYTRKYILDSYEEEGKQFKELFQGSAESAYGGDFTLTAEVSYRGEGKKRQVNGARKTAQENSLFAKDSGGETAYIEYLRHLQNLDSETSGAGGKTAAVQIADITCREEYEFIPIQNAGLKSYDGQEKEIRNLSVKAREKKKAYGLFEYVSGSQEEPWKFSNIRLINTSVDGTGADVAGAPAGALAGIAKQAAFENCWVYWEKSAAGKANLRDLLGDSNRGYQYQINGKQTVGGLIGSLDGGSIERCLAATLVKGEENVGGLAGSLNGTVKVAESYADCYLEGKAVGGLTGNLDSGSALTLTNCYAAGFISSPGQDSKAAGLCLGAGKIQKSQNVYSAMIYTQGEQNYPLCENNNLDQYKNTYYLYSSYFKDVTGTELERKCRKDYETLTDAANFESLVGNAFMVKAASDSNPYNLQVTLSLTAYAYPGLKSLEQYGDWGAEFQNGSLVYFEEYKKEGSTESEYGFGGANLDLLKEQPPVSDGYAVAFRDEEGIFRTRGIEITFEQPGMKAETIEYKASDFIPITYADVIAGKEVTYYLALLPDDRINTDFANKNYYQDLQFLLQTKGVEDQKSITGHFFYNPHFANTVIPWVDGLDLAALEAMAVGITAEIRTPRHLYMLSEHEEYYAGMHQYNFVQELDLDYKVYTGYGLFAPKEETKNFVQKSIGINAEKPFRNTYIGGCHIIQNVSTETDDNYLGLFGYNLGTLKDVVYLIDKDTAEPITRNSTTKGTVYAAGLAGYNGGVIQNCAVTGMKLEAYVYEYSTVYIGGLVGQNQGTILNSAADVYQIKADTTFSNAYAGGFVGTNGSAGRIGRSYAVGRISADRSRWGTVYACGFAGRNQGSIADSYAATDLAVSGGAENFGFSADESTNCFYLNGGNFQYENDLFTAQYRDVGDTAKEKGKTYKELAAEEGETYRTLGMEKGAASYTFRENDPPKPFPYPSAVTDADGKAIHYGEWPVLMELGSMGIFYWEKEVTYVLDEDGNFVKESDPSYHISSISVDTDNGTIDTNLFDKATLSTAHDDGRVITDYGYGYFYAKDMSAQIGDGYYDSEQKLEKEIDGFFASEGISNDSGNAMVLDKTIDMEAKEQLESLMEGKYVFKPFQTCSNSGEQGLYPIGENGQTWGRWRLKLNDVSYYFKICPFFADSMSYDGAGDKDGNQVPVSFDEDKLKTKTPGEAENPYQVRSVRQLQFINWNTKNKNTSTIIRNGEGTYGGDDEANCKKGNQSEFMFLSHVDFEEEKDVVVTSFWEQSHDIDGKGINYTPIAAFKDLNTKNNGSPYLSGWFGGNYDGADYTIKEVNIASDANCIGLFGVTLNANLKNIVLYSPSGKASVISKNMDPAGNNKWYAVGGLVGLAATSEDGGGNSISNCSVSGYSIKDQNKRIGYGGGGVGGLVGICNMSLSKCTADTSIIIDFNHSNSSRNVRVGGLAGSCQKVISSCYAGGSIAVELKNNKASNIYLGGIVGGYYMKTMKTITKTINSGMETDKNNRIENSYSYVTLFYKENIKSMIKAVYAIGGRGEITSIGKTQYKNCFYLDSCLSYLPNGVEPKDDDTTNTIELNYAQMSGKNTITIQGEEKELLTILKGAGFSKVTKNDADGNSIKGKYSYGTSQYLLGLDYPFPTILTQKAGDSTVNVHYGDWPIEGIQREDGDIPVDIDLFADYQAKPEDSEAGTGQQPGEGTEASINYGSAYVDKMLTLSEQIAVKDGIYKISYQESNEDGKIAAAAFLEDGKLLDSVKADGKKTLRITGKSEGSTVITVGYYKNEKEEQAITALSITVNVTAQLQLLPKVNPALVFINEKAETTLILYDKNGKELPEELKKKIDLEFDPIENVPITYLKSAVLEKIPDPDAAKPDPPEPDAEKQILPGRGALVLESLANTGNTTVTVGYHYTYPSAKMTPDVDPAAEFKYDAAGIVNISIVEPELTTGKLLIRKGDNRYEPEENIRITANGETAAAFKITDVKSSDSNTFAADLNQKTGEVTISGYEEGQAVMTLTLECMLGGTKHTVTVFVDVEVTDATTLQLSESNLFLYAESLELARRSISAELPEGEAAAFRWELSDNLKEHVRLEGADTDEVTVKTDPIKEELRGELILTVTHTAQEKETEQSSEAAETREKSRETASFARENVISGNDSRNRNEPEQNISDGQTTDKKRTFGEKVTIPVTVVPKPEVRFGKETDGTISVVEDPAKKTGLLDDNENRAPEESVYTNLAVTSAGKNEDGTKIIVIWKGFHKEGKAEVTYKDIVTESDLVSDAADGETETTETEPTETETETETETTGTEGTQTGTEETGGTQSDATETQTGNTQPETTEEEKPGTETDGTQTETSETKPEELETETGTKVTETGASEEVTMQTETSAETSEAGTTITQAQETVPPTVSPETTASAQNPAETPSETESPR